MTSLATPLGQPTPTAAPAAQPFGTRIVVGLLGVLLASLTAGLNGHVTEIAMTDVRGALAIGHDEGTWLTVLYEATQVAAMAFAPWCSVTFPCAASRSSPSAASPCWPCSVRSRRTSRACWSCAPCKG